MEIKVDDAIQDAINVLNDKTLLESLQEVRFKLYGMELKKTGYNPYGKFNYFQLEDFVPQATWLFYERGMTPVCWIEIDGNGIEYGYLTINKGVEQVMFKIPTAETGLSNAMQGMGAKVTYVRRYLYMLALDLVENDILDALPEAPKTSLITNEQWKMLNTLYTKEEIKAKYAELGITNGKQMKKEDAEKLIKAKSISDEEATKEKAFF